MLVPPATPCLPASTKCLKHHPSHTTTMHRKGREREGEGRKVFLLVPGWGPFPGREVVIPRYLWLGEGEGEKGRHMVGRLQGNKKGVAGLHVL